MLLPDLSPVNVVSAFFAVPVGIVYATEDIDPDDLTLASGWDAALLAFSGIGDYAKILTSTAKTFKLAEESSRTTPGPSGVDGKLFEYFGYIDMAMLACTQAAGVYRRGTGAKAILTDIAGAAAGIGYLFSKSKVKKKGAKAAAQFDVILDAVMSIVTGIGSILNLDDYSPIIREAMIFEAIAGLLELAGFTKNEEVVLGAMFGQAVLFASAGTIRLAAEAEL
jgi:hypothetical protein